MASRRSERARPTHPAPAAPTHSASSSSTSSNRADRVTRSNNKNNSSNKSSTPRSLSSEDNDEGAALQGEPPQTRLRARGDDHDDVDDDLDDVGSEEPEEEITRCICGNQEWPGPALVTGDPENDEGGGFFIQCDTCKVWQHGGCIGLIEDMVPDQYFCEECKPDLHRLFSNPQGQKYSWYSDVPLEIKQYRERLEKDKDKMKPSRKPSLPKEPEIKSTKDREKAAARAATEAMKKRRSTMNSRAALDDDEVLRKVLEESKTDANVAVSESTARKGKRSRDESEEVSLESKRPRTGSRSPSSSPTAQDEKDSIRSNGLGKGKPRGAAARSQRDKEIREEKERERAEAAGRRKGRAERRRAEGEQQDGPTDNTQLSHPTTDAIAPEGEGDAGDETPQQLEPVEVDTPDTPSATANPPPATKRSGRPPQKRANRSGRIPQTRDTNTSNSGGSPTQTNPENTPFSPPSRTNGDTSGNASDGTIAKQSKIRNWRLEKMSWNDIKKPAGMMLSYIQQRQVEMAEKTGFTAIMTTQLAGPVPGTKDFVKKPDESNASIEGEEDLDKFKDLSSVEMMDYLSRDIELWNQTVKDL